MPFTRWKQIELNSYYDIMRFGDSSKELDSIFNSLEPTIKYFKGLRNKQKKKSEKYLSTAKSMQKLCLSMHYFPINIRVYEVFGCQVA